MNHKVVLLTGGTGYLGSNLISALLAQGYKVVILKRRTSSLQRIEHLLKNIIFYTIEDADFLEIIKSHQVKTILHVAASYGRGGESLSEILEANLVFPLKLLEAALATGVSTFINTDTSLPAEVNAYARSKKQFTQWLISVSNQISVINMVPEYFYGPADDNWKLVTMILKKLVNRESVIEFTDGVQKRDFVYVEDVVSAYCTVLGKEWQSNGWHEFAVASGKSISIRNMAELCKRLSGNEETRLAFGVLPNRSNDVIQSAGDPSELARLGWSPKVSLESGLEKTIAYLRTTI